MASPVIMPRQGQSVESCIIAKWHKKKGDRVEAGEILFSYETDKASFDEEAKVSGILLDIFFEEGDDVPCLTNVCVIGKEGESAAEFNPNGGGTAAAGEEPVSKTTSALDGQNQAGSDLQKQHETTKPQNTNITSSHAIDGKAAVYSTVLPEGSGMRKISPRAKNAAEKAGIDWRFATPTGPDGRIIERDIEALRESGMVFTPAAMAEQGGGRITVPVTGTGLGGRITTADLAAAAASGPKGADSVAAAFAAMGTAAGATGAIGAAGAGAVAAGAAPGQEFEEVKLPNIRKVIARTMHQSLSSMAQLTLNSSFDISDILEFRKKLKEGKDQLGIGNITINDILLYAVSRTLTEHRDLNAHFLEDRMLRFRDVNLGIAVDTERGLMVPTLFRANRMSLDEISMEAKRLVRDCQSGTINPDLLKGGTFTVTNLGTLDVESFTPVINPPQTGILGVNNITQRVREVDGEYRYYPAMGLSLTFDHRALDGAPAARFLKDLKTRLENFSILLAKA